MHSLLAITAVAAFIFAQSKVIDVQDGHISAPVQLLACSDGLAERALVYFRLLECYRLASVAYWALKLTTTCLTFLTPLASNPEGLKDR